MSHTTAFVPQNQNQELVKITYNRLLVEVILVMTELRQDNVAIISEMLGINKATWAKNTRSQLGTLTLTQINSYGKAVGTPSSALVAIVEMIMGHHHSHLQPVTTEKEVTLDQHPQILSAIHDTIREAIPKYTGWRLVDR